MIDENDERIRELVEKEVAEILNNDPIKAIELYQRKCNQLTENNRELVKINRELKPKAEFHDVVTRCKTESLIRDAAKILNFKNMGQNKLFRFLRERHILNQHNMPYQYPFVDDGLFSYKINTWVNHQTGETHIVKTPVVTVKGMNFIYKLLMEAGYVLNDR